MMQKSIIRLLTRSCVALVFLFVAHKGYIYFTHDQAPRVQVIGLAENEHYCDNINGKITVNNKAAIKFCTAMIDNKPCEINQKQLLGKKEATHHFMLDTKNLENGKHLFTLELIDNSYHKNSTALAIPFVVDNNPLQGTFAQEQYVIDQGKTLHVIINTNKTLKKAATSYLNKEYFCCKTTPHATTYECFIPIECDQDPDEQILQTTLTDLTNKQLNLQTTVLVKTVDFPKQKGFRVSQEKLNDEKDVSLNNDMLAVALNKWIEHSPQEKLWKGPFELPCQVTRFSTPFGEIRTTPERGRYLHKAIDIVHHPKSVIWACARGKVIIKERYLMSGNTIVIDHGMGVHSHYYHLHDFADIEVGALLEKGTKIGRLGKTGYATGDHLHFEIRINNIAVDPLEWTSKMA